MLIITNAIVICKPMTIAFVFSHFVISKSMSYQIQNDSDSTDISPKAQGRNC